MRTGRFLEDNTPVYVITFTTQEVLLFQNRKTRDVVVGAETAWSSVAMRPWSRAWRRSRRSSPPEAGRSSRYALIFTSCGNGSGTRALLEILLHYRLEHVICLRGVVEHMSCASSEGEQQGDELLLSTTTSAPHCQRSVGISDLGNDVFPQLAFEGLHRGVRVENFRGPQCARSIVLVEPRRDRRRDRTE